MKIWKIFNSVGQCLEMRTLPDHIVMPPPWVLLGEEETAQYFLENPIPETPPPIKEVPAEIPLWAFRTAIRKAGLKESVEALLNALPEPQRTDALEHYEYGNYILRNHPLISALAFQLGLSNDQIDDIFVLAGSLS